MPGTCSQPECSKPTVGRGLCAKHYQRLRYHGKLDEVAPPPDVSTCAQCGSKFDPRQRRYGAMYCTRKCKDAAKSARDLAQRQRATENCEFCGESLAGKRTDARYCNETCGQNARNRLTSQARRASMLAARRPCAGCGDPIPDSRGGKASYCSWECRIRSRRHEAYGLTKAELDVLLAQHEKCAICASGSWGKKGPQVDHDHATGKVRGVLCINCNNGLGRFGDDSERLRAAADYVEAHR